MSTLVNFVMFQSGWFASVLLGASAWHWFGPVAVMLVLAVHLSTSPDRLAEQKLMVYALLIGFAWENLLSLAGLVVYPSGQPFGQFAPAWILAMWPLLAITLNVSLRWLKGRLMLSALFGAIGGPLAFIAGERLGAVVFPDNTLTISVLAVGWGLLFPLLMWLSGRHDGFLSRSQRTVEVTS